MILARSLAAIVAGSLLAFPALAQAPMTRSKSVASGQSVRLEVSPNLKQDCSPGPMPEIKVTGAPKNGSVITKVAKLKTPASYRCPNKDALVQALFYQSKPGYTGPDEVTFEVKSSDGQVKTQAIKLTVEAGSAKPAPGAKSEGTDL